MNLSDKEILQRVKRQTRDLLDNLENNNFPQAQQNLRELTSAENSSLFSEVGQLARKLHQSLNDFSLEAKITDIAASEIPDATERLSYVIEATEKAANTTMDKLEKCTATVDVFALESEELLNQWKKLYSRELQAGDFRDLCQRMQSHLEKNQATSAQLKASFSEVLIAQEYQDLTGQIIHRVINLVKDVEHSMVDIIKMFGNIENYEKAKHTPKKNHQLEGPIINADKREDVVKNQDDVDELLSSLGF